MRGVPLRGVPVRGAGGRPTRWPGHDGGGDPVGIAASVRDR
ncbi:hypothetical protein ACFSM7_07350 [Clavibacter michiganensis subsp. tessellarius]